MTDGRPPDLPETIGGRYRVLGELGRGNMGRVLKVAHVHTGELLAMKVLFPRGHAGALRERFSREARSLAQIRSEHVVRVLDADLAQELGGAPFIVTELLDGEDLSRYLSRRGRLDPAEVVELLRQVAAGLARVHEAGLIHRDLKPGNIFLHRQAPHPDPLPASGERGLLASDRVVVKLLDFGLVKTTAAAANEEEATVTRAGEILGTPLYMSPEQVLGANEGIGPSTDIWSVGILAFHLLAGRTYWNLRELPRGVFDIGIATIRPPSMLEPTLSVAFDAWFLRSCARNPAARWPDAATQARELAAALEQRAPAAKAPADPAVPLPTESIVAPRHAPAGNDHATVPEGSHGSVGGRQRRQVTVLFYRLVHTGAAAAMDPEEFEVLEHRLHAVLDEALGDSTRTASQLAHGGRLVFFGYPVAFGSDARRAVEAAFRLMATVTDWDQRSQREGRGLQVRVGIHTGVVLTGAAADAPGGPVVVGPALATATDLERDARPGQVVVSDATWRLLGGRFRGESVRDDRLVVLGPAEEGEAPTRPLPPMVGRQLELGLLVSALDAARSGESQTVLVSGDVGIGKSRLMQALREHPDAVGVDWLECRCSPYFQSTPFHPIVDLVRVIFARALDRTVGGAIDVTDVAELARLLALEEDAVQSLASLASLGGGDPSGVQRLSPMLRRERTIHALVSLLHARAATAPVILAIEDLHWADPSTLELLDELSVLRGAPLLTVLTARLDFTPSWRAPAGIVPLQLRRLPKADVARLIAEVADHTLPPEMAELVERSTDGVPLFVEELTRIVAEREAGSVDQAIRSGALPTTLREALNARLDRLGPARPLAEAAAVIGGDVTADDLVAVSGSDGSLTTRLQELVRANILQPRRSSSQTVYAFQHALLRDAAYASLPGETRRALHVRAARAMAARSGVAPEVLAHHYAEGGVPIEAARLLHEAGQAALARSANAEARRHFERALALIETLEQARPDRHTVKVDPALAITIQTMCGMAWVVSRGYAVPEAETHIARAMERVRALGAEETPALVPALWAQWLFAQVRGQVDAALEASGHLLRLAARVDDAGVRMLAHLAEGTTVFGVGRFEEAESHLDLGLACYDANAHASYRFIYGQDPWMLGMVFKAWLRWCTGHPDTAARLVTDAVAHADALRHPNSQGFALAIASIVHHYRGDLAALTSTSQALLTLSSEQGWIHWLGHARLWMAAADVLRGDLEAGVSGMLESRQFSQQAGERSGGAHYEAVLIGGLCRAGRLDDAEARLGAAQDGFYEYAFEPELLQIDAEIRRRRGDLAGAVERLLRAFDSAARRDSRSHQLRAATALVGLARERGDDPSPARTRLGDVLSAFDEGHDTADLVAARAAFTDQHSDK